MSKDYDLTVTVYGLRLELNDTILFILSNGLVRALAVFILAYVCASSEIDGKDISCKRAL
jgi:hypothetical protein